MRRWASCLQIILRLLVVKMLLHRVSNSASRLGMTITDVMCAIYMATRAGEFPDQNQKADDTQVMGRLAKAMYGAPDAP